MLFPLLHMEHHLYLDEMAPIHLSNLIFHITNVLFHCLFVLLKHSFYLESLLVIHYVISFQDLHFDIVGGLLTLQIQNNLVTIRLLAIDVTLLSLIDYSTVPPLSDNHK